MGGWGGGNDTLSVSYFGFFTHLKIHHQRRQTLMAEHVFETLIAILFLASQ